MVEHLKVRVYLLGGGLMVEPACAFNLLIGWGGLMVEHLKVLMVEHLKVMAALTVEPACASLSVEPPKG